MVNFGDYENPVRFSNAAADDFSDLLRRAAGKISDFESVRVGAESLASDSFSGYFSTVFARNMRVCSYDGQALQEALTRLASQVEYVKEQAGEENRRRQLVREYFARHDDWWEKGWDWLVGQEEPPHLPPADPPAVSVTASVTNNREQELEKGPAGGVSSAIPENLMGASNNIRDAGTNLISGSRLADCYEIFTSQCQYGSIQVNDVFKQLDRWNSLNENDVNWLRVVGDAFALAGSGSGVTSLSDQAIAQVLASRGVDCVREDLDISSPTLAGIDTKTGYIEDPVNSATGNFVEPELDLSFVGSAAGLGLSRLYNSVGSLNGYGGVFGPGWSSVLDQCLELDGDGCVGWLMADGRLVPFGVVEDSPVRAVRDSFWVCRTGIDRVRNGWLMDRIANIVGVDAIVWLVSDNAGGQWYFTETGMWLGESRGAGSGLFVDRDDAGFVVGILSERGRFMEVSYTSEGLVERVGSDDGREVCYVYDAQSRLVRVDGLSGSREYVWDGLLITRVVDAAGVVECVNVYDNKGRVTSQITEFERRVKYVYLPGNITVVSDGDGGRANTWIANAYGHTVGVIDSDDQRQSMSYDRWGNLVMVRDRNGNQRVRLYDERSRLVREVLPSKAHVSYKWDEFDRIVEVSSSSGGAVSYEYADDTCLNPCRIVDPLGGVSELVWRDGLLDSVVDPQGVWLGFDYDAHGDLISVVNGQGAVAAMERDAVGHVVKTISPLGFVTEFSYSPAGLLEKIVDAEGGVWTYHYDKAGRLVKNTDPTGVVQSFEYGPHGKLVKAVDGLGRATVQEFDDLGNVQAIKLPDGAEYAFTYDGLSRLKSFTDPSGSSWTYQWDKLGNFAGVVDPEGVKATVTGSSITGRMASCDSSGKTDVVVEFDEFARPVKTVDVSGDAEIVTYNQAGQPVEFLDADGGLTILTRDLAGRVVSHTSAQGLNTSYTYDACGRLATVLAPNGGMYRCEYDADSRLTKVINPVGDESSYVYDKVGRLVKAVVPGQGVIERKYDKAGRLIFTRDSLGGPRWFTYDKAGQLVKAINGLAGLAGMSTML
ncbi:DUF6531 domain-containing protein [Arcanobacterium pinnipediorum]|uniref:DUF6531 domain-containing protein n=1 Tax=Arcanobacterium pinnipediorum TaxID=1503041 RepID=A0ABY5AI28_9ACTO|nr:DUF6531 domain-containing protein [Arcanobacterium pinnipediorum]USR79515.1 DUF6531 domain-containing protein [Arcanobacterium pinnipediorum]